MDVKEGYGIGLKVCLITLQNLKEFDVTRGQQD